MRVPMPSVNVRRLSGFCAAAFLLFLCLPARQTPPAVADGSSGTVMRVEEDYELVLNEPGSERASPQFHTVMSPYNHVLSGYAQVSWNYRELPEFAAGGLQIQAWKGENDYEGKDIGDEPLSRDAETIAWTQVLETDDHQLTFKIINGQSLSWGAFGGDELSIVVLPVTVGNLNRYSSTISKSNSWISYGSNRVNLLQIKEVRRYGSSGNLVSRDTTPKVIYQATEE